MPVDRVDIDLALANGAARGTGHYRPPALMRVAAAAPYFHDGSVATLEEVLAPERLSPTIVADDCRRRSSPVSWAAAK